MPRTAAALIIGNEILSGKIEDTNGPYLIRSLRARGIELRRVVVCPDEVDVIAEAAAALASIAELVVTSGGLGPTHDDVTVRAIAKALGRPVVRDAAMERRVRGHYGDALTPEALRLADAPEGASFVDAPGLWVPVLTVDRFLLLPGIPQLFRSQLDVALERHVEPPFVLREIYLGVWEHVIAAVLDRVAAEHAAVRIGSYPVLGTDYRVKLTLEARDPLEVERAFEALRAALPPGAVLRTL